MPKLHYNSVKGRVGEIIEDILALAPLTSRPEMAFVFNLVCEEIVSNVANYAYPDGSDGPLSITVEEAEGTVMFIFTDRGTPFNPLMQAQPDTSLPPNQRPIGGLGIFLVKQMMDDVAYSYVDGCNVLTLRKSTQDGN